MRLVLYIYIVGACLVALRLSWPMVFRFDAYDWKYSPTWRRFCWQVLLWPLLTPIFPKALLDPYDFLTNSEAADRRELDSFAQTLRPAARPSASFQHKQCHRADQNQPVVGSSKPATLRRESHNSFFVGFKEWLAAR